MPLLIDRSLYVSSPRLGISTGATLLGQLVDVANVPELEASAAILDSARELGSQLTRVRAIDDAATLAGATATAAGDLELDQRSDRTSKAIMMRLEARVLLDDGEPAQRAAQALALLYPEGLAFTKASFAAQDAVMQRMVRQLKEPTLAKTVEELVGPEYIKTFKKLAKAYSAMVKAMGRVVGTTLDQREVIVEMQAAIVRHAICVLAELRDADPQSVARTRALLAPIDNFRARASTSSARAAGPATPTVVEAEAEEQA